MTHARTPAPFTGSRWLWPGDHRFDLPNRSMQARKGFRLAQVPRRAEVQITGDSRYRLWVNGVAVTRGPARGYQERWPFDRVDVAPFLRKGRNVLAVQVLSLGVGTFGYIHAGGAGLLVAGRIGDQDIASNGTWKVRFAPDQVRHLRRASLQLGFQEEVDTAALDDWKTAGYDDTSWSQPREAHAGSMPWHALDERGIPLMREALQVPQRQTHVARRSRGASTDADPVAALVADRPAWKAAANSLRPTKDWVEVVLPASGRSGISAVNLDLGEIVVANLDLAWSGGSAGACCDLVVSERVEDSGPVIHDPAGGCREAFGLRLRLDGKAGAYEQFDHWGFRHVAIVARGTTHPLKLRLRLRTVGYPLDPVADLRTGDATLDAVWDISVRAQQRCALDAYVDCPWREQAQWWGDARVQAANTFVLSGDHRLLARGIRQIAGMEVPNGLTYGHAPTIAHSCILPDFTLTWISTLHDLWWQTGDLDPIREQLPRVRRALAYFRDRVVKRGPAKGLLPYDDRYWLFLDWCPIFKGGHPTLYQFLFVQALDHLADLLRRCGERAEAAQVAREAKAARAAAVRLQQDGIFAGGRDWEGRLVPQDSAHCDALAALLKLVPQRQSRLIQRLKDLCARDIHSKEPMRPSPFFMHYVLCALDEAGEGAVVVDCIRRWWGDMVARGLDCTEEMWFGTAGRASLCHAWSAHPIVHLTRILLGIRQTGVAWSTVDIAPAFLTPRASGAVATPHGPIRMEWERRGDGAAGTVTMPKGVKATLRLPGLKPQPLRPGKTAFRVAD